MEKITVPVKRLNIEISLTTHCDIKKYAASRNMSMTVYISGILNEQIIKEKKNEQIK